MGQVYPALPAGKGPVKWEAIPSAGRLEQPGHYGAIGPAVLLISSFSFVGYGVEYMLFVLNPDAKRRALGGGRENQAPGENETTTGELCGHAASGPPSFRNGSRCLISLGRIVPWLFEEKWRAAMRHGGLSSGFGAYE